VLLPPPPRTPHWGRGFGGVGYCTPADLVLHGMPRGAATAPGRLVGAVSTAANTIELDGHDFMTGDEVSFRAEAGGVLPSPLVAGVTYFAIAVSDSLFSVAATAGGAALDLTTAGSRIVAFAPRPREAAIEWATRLIDDMLPAGSVPLTAPYPSIVTMTCAELAAWKLTRLAGTASKSLTEIADAARQRLARWARGVPIRGDNAPTPTGLACSTPAVASTARPWRSYGGIA